MEQQSRPAEVGPAGNSVDDVRSNPNADAEEGIQGKFSNAFAVLFR